jgi:hypothetical protein
VAFDVTLDLVSPSEPHGTLDEDKLTIISLSSIRLENDSRGTN